MKTVQRFGFILFIFFIGIIVGHTSLTFSLFITVPLFIAWIILWDNKKFEATQKKYYEELKENYHYK